MTIIGYDAGTYLEVEAESGQYMFSSVGESEFALIKRYVARKWYGRAFALLSGKDYEKMNKEV